MKAPAFISRFTVFLLIGLAAVVAQAQVNTWVNKAHMSVARFEPAAATGSDGRIYVFGGLDTHNDPLASAEVYDPATNSWSSIANMSTTLANAFAVKGADGKIYVFGNGNTVEAYDSSTNSYTQLTNAPIEFSGGGIGNDGRVYVFDIGAQLVYAYDISLDQWSKVNTNPSTFPTDSAYCTGPNGLLYRIGGYKSNELDTVDTYDAVADNWGSAANISTSRDSACAAVGGDGHIYLVGGFDGTDRISSVESYDPSSNSWSSAPSLATTIIDATAVSDQGKVYVLGGINDQGTTDNVECFQPSLLKGQSVGISAEEGSDFDGSVATFTDMDTAQTSADFSASVDWGDGSSPTVASVDDDGGAGQFKVSDDHTYAHYGSYTATVSITDADGETTTVTDAVTVTDAKVTLLTANITAQSGISFSGPVGFFSDANPLAQITDFTATIDWGDGSAIQNATLLDDPGGGKFDVDGMHTYSAVGTYSVHIKIVETGGGEFLIHESASVVAPSAVVTAGHINAVEDANFNGQVAKFTDADPNQVAANFTATIDWGDGTTNTGSVTSDGSGGFLVSGNHTYAEEGSYAVVVTVAVTGGISSSSTGSAQVSDAALSATGFDLICKGQNFSNTVASFTDADLLGTASDYAASIYWGDGRSSNGAIVAAGSGWKVVGSHSYQKRGKYTATITIRDMGGATASATTHINAGPVK